MPKHTRTLLTPFILLALALATASPVFAQNSTPGEAIDFTQLLPAALTLLLPVGMILLISSAMPEDRAPATAINLLIVWSVAALAYFGVGFAFHFGGIAQVSANPDLRSLYWEWYPLDQSVDVGVARLWGVVALRGWFLSGEASTPGALLLFLSHVSLVGAAAMVPAGALIRQGRATTAILTGLLTGTLIYPLTGNWLWGGGWLSNLGGNLGYGHGLVDFGGAGVIFLTGSAVTLVALFLFRPTTPEVVETPLDDKVVITAGASGRLTVYEGTTDSAQEEETLQATPMPSAYLPILSMLGAGLVLLGWFGLTTGGHAPTAVDFAPAQAAVNGLLAALAGALTAAGYSWFTTKELNPLMTARGLIAGLIVAMAGAPFAPVWLFVVAGLLMGLLTPLLIYLFDQRMRLTDELGTLTIYGVSAIVSLLLVAFFADGRAGQGWNGIGATDYQGVVGQGVSGLAAASGFASDWPGQLQAQLLGMGVMLVWALLTSYLLFQTIIAVANAWARTGLELAGPSLRADDLTQPNIEEPPEDTIDSQLVS